MLTGTTSVVIALLLSIVGVGFVVWQMRRVLAEDQGNQTMREISHAVQIGAAAFLRREYTYLAGFVVVVALVIGAFLNWQTALTFVVGAAISASCGYLGMYVAVRANVRTAAASVRSLNDGLRVAFSSGSVMGMAVVSFGLLGLSIMYLLFTGDIEQDIAYLAGFGFGASSIALFARVGGGIFTKAADVGADLVGKVEAGIPEDDPRNPAVIADNVGDNVGDVAGMGADLFESYVGGIISAMALAYALTQTKAASLFGSISDWSAFQTNLVLFPVILAGLGILASVVGTFAVKTNDENQIHSALFRGLLVASVLVVLGAAGLCAAMGIPWKIYFAVIMGLAAGVAVGQLTEYYTSMDKGPVRNIATQSETGPATNIIAGLGTGMMSCALPMVVLCVAIFFTYQWGELYGIAIAAVGMLSTLGISLGVDAYGPVADNAGGIAEMSECPPEVRKRTDALDAVGNTTAAVGKGFAIGSAALTALALFSTFHSRAEVALATLAASGKSLDVSLWSDSLKEPNVLIGILIGGTLPFIFSALTMGAVGRAANKMIEEVRRQFRTIPGLMEGKAEPDSATCVAISTKAALAEMIIPGVLAVVVPVATGLLLGVSGLSGLLAGSLVTGVLLAIMMANAGGAWDNAKKYIEKGAHGGKGSPTHKAAVIGDTVGDPFKDTSGPSLNILIKLMAVVSVIFVPWIVEVIGK